MPLIGREQEAAAAQSMLMRPDVRLLTFTGPPGIGKTRLALQVAANVADQFRDGAVLVDLASTVDPALVVSAIAQALGVREAGGQSLLELVKRDVGDKQLLLVLDNFEQVVAAAPQIAGLLAACPGLKIVVTSREILHLSWEHEFPVPPLRLPDLEHLPPPESLAGSPAVALFIERARAVHPDFTLAGGTARDVAAICARLDGLPLAIELAAARIRLLPPHALLARLQSRLGLLTGGQRDLPARQQTLRGALAWSYDLLEPAEKTLFKRLSVFAGGCTLEAAEAVCNPDGDLRINLLDGLTSLAGKSLLQQEAGDGPEPRYRMLETIREYGSEQLAAGGEAAGTQGRHAAFFAGLAERAEQGFGSAQLVAWLGRLEREHDNLRAALRWAAEGNEAETSLRLAGALTRFWLMRSYHAEGRDWLSRALSMAAGVSGLSRAKALRGAAHVLWVQGDYEGATALSQESLALSRELGDRYGIAFSLGNLGILAYLRGDHGHAVNWLEESLGYARSLNDRWLMSFVLIGLGRAVGRGGDPKRAEALLEDGLGLAQDVEDRWLAGLARTCLGTAARQAGAPDRAAVQLRESLGIARDLGHRWGIAWNLEELARVATALGQPERAARLLGAAAILRAMIKTPLTPVERADVEEAVTASRGRLSETEFAAAWEAGKAMPLGQAIEYALGIGEALLRSADAGTSPPKGHQASLTPRQEEVAALVARGHTNREIARTLVVTERTAATHIQHILNKLGFNSRAQIAVWAVEHGLHAPSPTAD